MVSIQLQDKVAEALTARARSEGLSLEDFLARFAETPGVGMTPRLSSEELDALIEAESSDESTYEGTYSRADIYRDHA